MIVCDPHNPFSKTPCPFDAIATAAGRIKVGLVFLSSNDVGSRTRQKTEKSWKKIAQKKQDIKSQINPFLPFMFMMSEIMIMMMVDDDCHKNGKKGNT